MRFVGQIIGGAAGIVALLTIASLPWMLGGVVPLARVALLTGAVAGGVLSLLASLLTRQHSRAVPAILLPLLGIAFLGLYQLRPVAASLHTNMGHAIGAVADLPDLQSSPQATLSPADTRTLVGSAIAVSLLCLIAFRHLSERRWLSWAACLMILNGIGVSSVGLTQLFHREAFWLNDTWALGTKQPFATFVNPNNAAGWLCLCTSLALGWLTFLLSRSSTEDRARMGKLNVPFVERAWQQLIQFLADLTIWQVISFVCMAFLGASVAATLSRGGILALVSAIALTIALKSSVRRLPLAALVLSICGAGVYGMLNWLELDENIIGEMETLRDLDEAAGSRPRHWLDSSRIVLDFPITGTGLGSYQFANLPYQSRHYHAWFRNADNQFVEILVEGGLIGLLLFAGIGVSAMITGAAGWKQSKKRNRTPNAEHTPRTSRRMLAAVGTVVIAATLSQAASGFFDYGVAMPAAAALFLTITSAAAGYFHLSEPHSSVTRTGAINCGQLSAGSIQLCLVIGAACFIPDQIQAVALDEYVVLGANSLSRPATPEKIEAVADVANSLDTKLQQNRFDDSEGNRILYRLGDADFRWKVLLETNGPEVREHQDFNGVWRGLQTYRLAVQSRTLAEKNSEAADQAVQQLDAMLDETGWPEILKRTQERFPLMPNVAEARAELAAIFSDQDQFTAQVNYALAVRPANAETCFRLGSIALHWQQKALAEQLWKQSIALTHEFQSTILADAQGYWSSERVMELFGPKNYIASVTVAQRCADIQLRTSLYDLADEQWESESESQSSELIGLVRANHLVATKRIDAAVEWLQSCVVLEGDHVSERRLLAELREKQGRFRDALGEWYTILYLKPGDAEAESAITRLKSLK